MNKKSTIFLVDESVDMNILKSKVKEYDNIRIISYDYYTHKSLNNLGLNHEKIEDYLDEEDRLLIDEKVIELSTNWYKHESLQKYLKYEDINLGSLLEMEFTKYFFNILKKFIGTMRIIEKEKPEMVVTSLLLSRIITTFPDKVKSIPINTIEKSPELFFDKIEIKFNLGKKPIVFQISRKNFLIIKKIAEKITSSVFKLKFNMKDSLQDSILLLDFNPILYGDLMTELGKTKKQVILLNQRRPAIMNFKSLNVVKNANCKVLSLDDLLDPEIVSKIEMEKNKIQKKLDELWNLDVFNEIFLIEGYSMWETIRTSFSNICLNRFMECIFKIQLTKKLFDKINVKSILEWAHKAVEERIILIEANKRKIPITTLQHGTMTLNEKFARYRSITPFFPSDGAKMAIWGKLMMELNLKNGINENELIVSGSPRHDIFFKKKNYRTGGTILIAGTSFVEINCSGNDSESYEKFENMIKTICESSTNIHDKKLAVKMHPAPLYFDVKKVIHSVDTSIPIYYDKDLITLLQMSDVVIALNYSTIILDAMILGVPTITIIIEDQGYEEEFPIKSGATLCVRDPQNFEKALNDVLYDMKIRNELISKGYQFVDMCLSNQGNASKYLADVISKL